MISLSVGTSYGKHLFPIVGAAGTTTYRVGFAALILLAVWRPWRRPLTRRDAQTIALYGVSLGTMNFFFYLSLKTIPLGIAVALEFTGPLAVAVASSRRAIDFVWVAFAALGVALLLPLREGAARLDPVGVAFALAGAVCWALYIVFGKRAGHLHGGQATSLGMATAALIVAPFGFAHAGAALFDPKLLLAGLAVAVFSSALPYSLEMVALKRLPHRTFSVLLSMEPALSSLAALAILDERLTPLQWLAIASIITASAGTATTARAAEVPPPVID
jgi:inner membrane transporter RhtA